MLKQGDQVVCFSQEKGYKICSILALNEHEAAVLFTDSSIIVLVPLKSLTPLNKVITGAKEFLAPVILAGFYDDEGKIHIEAQGARNLGEYAELLVQSLEAFNSLIIENASKDWPQAKTSEIVNDMNMTIHIGNIMRKSLNELKDTLFILQEKIFEEREKNE